MLPDLPDYGDLYSLIVRSRIMAGKTSEARSMIPMIRKLNRPERADLHEAAILFREADCVGCLQLLRKVRESKYRRGAADSMMQEGLLLIDTGYAEAAADGVASFLASGSWVDAEPQQIALLAIQAWAEMLSGRSAAAIANAHRAIQGEPGPFLVGLAGTSSPASELRSLRRPLSRGRTISRN